MRKVKHVGFFIILMELCILASWLFALGWRVSVKLTKPKMYPTVGEVIELIDEWDCVTVETHDGHQWVFGPIDDWDVGDSVCLVMNDNGTEFDVTDDTIVARKYFR